MSCEAATFSALPMRSIDDIKKILNSVPDSQREHFKKEFGTLVAQDASHCLTLWSCIVKDDSSLDVTEHQLLINRLYDLATKFFHESAVLPFRMEILTGEKFQEKLQDPSIKADLIRLNACYEEWPYLCTLYTCGLASATAPQRPPFHKYTLKRDATVGLAYDSTTQKVIGIIGGYALSDGEERYKEAFTTKAFPEKVYHLVDCIVAPEHRGKKVATDLYTLFERSIKSKNAYNTISLAVVDRPDDFQHAKKPNSSCKPEALWQKLGFKKLDGSLGTGKYTTEWMLIGTHQTMKNPMQFFTKSI